MKSLAPIFMMVLAGCAQSLASADRPLTLRGDYAAIGECVVLKLQATGYGQNEIHYTPFTTTKTAQISVDRVNGFISASTIHLIGITLRQIGDGKVAATAEAFTDIAGKYVGDARTALQECGN